MITVKKDKISFIEINQIIMINIIVGADTD